MRGHTNIWCAKSGKNGIYSAKKIGKNISKKVLTMGNVFDNIIKRAAENAGAQKNIDK